MSTSHYRAKLRRARQQKRAEIINQHADKKFISPSVARLFIIFGGDIETYNRDEARQGQRSPRILRAIRKFKRQQEAQSGALRSLRHG